jgi:SPOR domain
VYLKMEICGVWRFVTVTCCLALSGCIGAAQPSGLRPAMQSEASSGQNITLHRVIDQDMWDRPLLPQPGNIWADVLPRSDSRLDAAGAPAADQLHDKPTAAAGARATQAAPAMMATSHAATSDMGPTNDRPTRDGPTKDGPTKDGPTKDGPTKDGSIAPGAKAVASLSHGLEAGDHPMVQLAAVANARQAVAAWRRLRRDAPQLTDGHNPTIMSADVNGRHVWRLRADGFEDIAAARAFCIGIRTANADCWVVPAYAIR